MKNHSGIRKGQCMIDYFDEPSGFWFIYHSDGVKYHKDENAAAKVVLDELDGKKVRIRDWLGGVIWTNEGEIDGQEG